MAGTAAFHPHLHLPAVNRKALSIGWPRRAAAVLMILVGASFVITTLVANLFNVGPSFDRLTSGFRPIMTQQAIQTDKQDLASLTTAGDEINTKMLPALAQQLKMTPDQLSGMMQQNFPAVAAGLSALPSITPQFTGMVNTLDQNRHVFASADAIPTKSLPAKTVPWSLLAVGLIAVGLGVVVWFKPHGSAIVATALGAALIVLPLMFSMVGKAADADTLNKNLKPVYNQQLINDANGAIKTLTAMGTQMQSTMLPALAQQLKMQPDQMQAFLAQNFPATATALKDLPASTGRFQNVVNQFDKHLSDWKVLKPVTFTPIVWLMLSGGIALFVLGGAGVWITSGKSEAPKES